MGTIVQCKTYFPGYYSMRDLNEDTDSSWSRYYKDKTLSGHLYNGFPLRPVNGYSEYDKQMLRGIMLKHEAVFRKQVYELHRLYRTQKDLMDGFQKKGMYRYSILTDTPQSNSFSSQMPSEGTKRIWQVPHLPVVSTNYNMGPVAGTDDTRPPLNFFKESTVQSGQFPIEKGAPQKVDDLHESKLKRFPRRMFDLQLPADVYIESEDADRKEKGNVAASSFRYTVPSNKIYGADPGKDAKLTLGTDECPSRREDSWKLDSLKQNGLPPRSLADLNQPIGQIFCDVSVGSASTHFRGPRTHHEENREHQLPMRANTSFLGLRTTLFRDRHSDDGSCSDFPYADKEEIRQEWPFYSNEAGEGRRGGSFFSSGLHNEKLPMSSESIQLKPTKNQEIPLPNKTDTWFRQKPNLGIEFSGRSPLAISNNSGPAAPGMPSSFSVDNKLNYTCTASPLVSPAAKTVNSISHIGQALPCFNGSATLDVQSKRPNSAIQGSSNACYKWQDNGDLKAHLRLGGEASCYPNGFHHHFQLDSNFSTFGKLKLNGKRDSSAFGNDEDHGQKILKGLQCTNVKSATDVNLNEVLLNGIQDGLTTQQDIRVSAVEAKFHVSSGGNSWFTKKPACNGFVDLNKNALQMELAFSQAYPQLILSNSAVDPELEQRQEKEKGLSECNFQDFHSTLQVEDRMRRNEVLDSPSDKKILGFPIVNTTHHNDICSPSHQEQSVTDDTKGREKDGISYIELSCDVKAPSLERLIPVGDPVRSSTRFRSLINLNSTCMDNPYSTEMSPEGEVEVPSRLSIPSVAAKVASMIDLEAPLASQMEENSLPQEESMFSSEPDGSQETKCSHEALVREAAEDIVRMSSDKCSNFNGTTCGPFPPDPCDTLKWFAEVVSANADCATVLRGGDGGSESSDDGLDHFELMTLKLEEIKGDEYWCRPWEPENQKEEEKGTASLLLTRPRRGQARRWRQRRDFQKDILPGLTSLSRHEVTEDLQTIGGLMKASGRSWQMGLTRRNTGRNGLNSKARGRRQPRSLAITVAEIQVSPPTPQPTNAEFEVDGSTMIGWGRITRRPRRQRCPPVNVSNPNLQA